MAGRTQVLQARKKIAQVLDVRYENVELGPDNRNGGLLVTVKPAISISDREAGELHNQLQHETGATVLVGNSEGKLHSLSVSGGLDMDSGIERLALIDASKVARQAFPDRSRA